MIEIVALYYNVLYTVPSHLSTKPTNIMMYFNFNWIYLYFFCVCNYVVV